jgi:hypothetical protein
MDSPDYSHIKCTVLVKHGNLREQLDPRNRRNNDVAIIWGEHSIGIEAGIGRDEYFQSSDSCSNKPSKFMALYNSCWSICLICWELLVLYNIFIWVRPMYAGKTMGKSES